MIFTYKGKVIQIDGTINEVLGELSLTVSEILAKSTEQGADATEIKDALNNAFRVGTMTEKERDEELKQRLEATLQEIKDKYDTSKGDYQA